MIYLQDLLTGSTTGSTTDVNLPDVLILFIRVPFSVYVESNWFPDTSLLYFLNGQFAAMT